MVSSPQPLRASGELFISGPEFENLDLRLWSLTSQDSVQQKLADWVPKESF